MKKGYTLVELLIVIVVLSIVAIVIIPNVLKIIDSSRRQYAKDSASQVVQTVKLYHANKLIENGGVFDKINFICDKECISNDNIKLDINGTTPDNGNIEVSSDGTISGKVSFYDGEYVFYICNDEIFEEEIASCSPRNVLTVTTSEYKEGDKVNYAGLTWNVIKDNGDNVTLILNNIIGSTNHGEEPYSYSTSNIKTKLDNWFDGNNTLVKAKEESKLLSMNFSDGREVYDDFIRIPTKEEANFKKSLDICKALWCNIEKSYWLLTYNSEEEAISYIWSIKETGEANISIISENIGIRPVITVVEQ